MFTDGHVEVHDSLHIKKDIYKSANHIFICIKWVHQNFLWSKVTKTPNRAILGSRTRLDIVCLKDKKS